MHHENKHFLQRGTEIGRYKSYVEGTTLPFQEQQEGLCGLVWDNIRETGKSKLKVSIEILYIYNN